MIDIPPRVQKAYIASTADPVGGFNPIPTMGRGKFEILSVQWDVVDGVTTFEIEEAKGWVSGEENYNKNKEDRVGPSTIIVTSDTLKRVQYMDPPLLLTGPVFYKDNKAGGGNKALIKYNLLP